MEQIIHQYGGVGLLLWAAAQVLVLFIAWSRAGIQAKAQAESVVTEERQIIHNMLKRRDEDARVQFERTEKLEGEINLLKEVMSIERAEADEQLGDLNKRLDEARGERNQLEERLKASEASIRCSLRRRALRSLSCVRRSTASKQRYAQWKANAKNWWTNSTAKCGRRRASPLNCRACKARTTLSTV